jgi:hypothetical protein
MRLIQAIVIGVPGGLVVGWIGHSATVNFAESFLIWWAIFTIAAFVWLKRQARARP